MQRISFGMVEVIYLLMLFVPNLFWTKHQPKDYEKFAEKENKILQIFERTGEVLCCLMLIFSDCNIGKISAWSLWLGASFLLMLLYECYWIRYFRSPKTMKDFYSSLLGIPTAGATLPVCAFFLLGIYSRNPFLSVSAVILGIGHIGIHRNHCKEVS